ncbi:MAG TPA: TetR/AcrR family transcriptional regulator [Methylomirabilota bacterium]|nr:TetR/AcrR family transcriptional regulator [Methylomirabilota bacterium]
MPTAHPASKRKVDPRIERSRQAILAAALEELGEIGYGGFVIESVAARAGVGKSTIYRYWPDKLALIADAFRTFHEDALPDVESGTPRDKVARVLRHVAEVVAVSTFSACIPALIDAAERDPNVRKFYVRFQRDARQPLIKVIAEGVRDGSFPARANPEFAAFALLGAIFFCRLATNKRFDPDSVGDLIDTVMGTSADHRRPTRAGRS